MKERYFRAVEEYHSATESVSNFLEGTAMHVCQVLTYERAPKSKEVEVVQRILSYWGSIQNFEYYPTIDKNRCGQVRIQTSKESLFYSLSWDIFDAGEKNVPLVLLRMFADDIVLDSRDIPVRLSGLAVLDVDGKTIFSSYRQSLMEIDWWFVDSDPQVILVESSRNLETDPADACIVLSSDTELKYIDQRLRRWNAKDGWYHN